MLVTLQVIDKIDKNFTNFCNLEEVSLTGNEISVIEHLPVSLKILDLGSNKITRLPDLSHLSLCHLGLGHNLLSVRSFPPPPAQRRPHFIAVPIRPPCDAHAEGRSAAEGRTARRTRRPNSARHCPSWSPWTSATTTSATCRRRSRRWCARPARG
jgi:Leucine-rich repeat (LRR) protein